MIKLSINKRVYLPDNIKTVDIWEVLNAIKTGYYNGENLIPITKEIQMEQNHDKQNELKRNYLPCVLYNGVFNKKADSCLVAYSNITAMDFMSFF